MGEGSAFVVVEGDEREFEKCERVVCGWLLKDGAACEMHVRCMRLVEVSVDGGLARDERVIQRERVTQREGEWRAVNNMLQQLTTSAMAKCQFQCPMSTVDARTGSLMSHRCSSRCVVPRDTRHGPALARRCVV